MRRITFAFTVFTLFTVFALFASLTIIAAPVPKEKAVVKDEDAIQGVWKIEEFDSGGGPNGPPKELLDTIRFEFKKDGKMSMTGGPGPNESRDGEYKMDSSAKPKSIDMTMDTMPALGIYELDGDTFRLCISEGPNKARPEEFKADGKRTVIIKFKRVVEEKKDK
jgi:uncharacterized protein (TIGR03067 family)